MRVEVNGDKATIELENLNDIENFKEILEYAARESDDEDSSLNMIPDLPMRDQLEEALS